MCSSTHRKYDFIMSLKNIWNCAESELHINTPALHDWLSSSINLPTPPFRTLLVRKKHFLEKRKDNSDSKEQYQTKLLSVLVWSISWHTCQLAQKIFILWNILSITVPVICYDNRLPYEKKLYQPRVSIFSLIKESIAEIK